MADILEVQMIFEHQSGLPKDRVVNVWHFLSPTVPSGPTDYATARGAVEEFYFTDITSGVNIANSVLSQVLSGAWTTKVYNLADAPPRVPVETNSGTATMSGGDSMPTEVAICLSFSAAVASGDIAARRRGRVFIGPVRTGIMTGSDDPTVSSTTRSRIRDAADRLKDDADSNWGVFSRVDNALYLVDHGWVDDAFDTQRRRGIAPTTRTSFS